MTFRVRHCRLVLCPRPEPVRPEESLETLRDEAVVLECFFLEQTADGDYLIGVMTAESFERSRQGSGESAYVHTDK